MENLLDSQADSGSRGGASRTGGNGNGRGDGNGNGSGGGGNDKATARRLKKRELDRKAQRVARERTKSRIAHLEALVEHFQANDPNSELSQLTSRLSDVTEQRDSLIGVLKSIECTIRRHLQAANPSPQPALDSPRPRYPRPPVPPDSSISSTDGGARALPLPSLRLSSQSAPTGTLENGPPMGSALWVNYVDFSSGVPCNTLPSQNGEVPSLGQSIQNGWHTAQCCSGGVLEDDVIVPSPSPRELCDCAASVDSDTAPATASTWRTANSALHKRAPLTSSQLIIEDFTGEDTPVRVILEGWDSVERSGKMSLSWKKLRMIDETCFFSCGQTERLAILRYMHLLLTYHGEPTPERQALLPRWFWTRPAQKQVPHSYAIDFFVWPGIRERFVYEQHQYCTNLFWELFRLCFHIQWPHDFSDCYTVDEDTGRYQLTSQFDRCTRDINSWRMKTDFFQQFPILSSDIPTSQGLPMAIFLGGKNGDPRVRQSEDVEEIVDDNTMHEQGRVHRGAQMVSYIPTPQTLHYASIPMQSSMYAGLVENWEDGGLDASSAWPAV